MKGQFEQQCNAVAAQKMGATVIDSLNLLHYRTINLWLSQGTFLQVDYQDQTESIIQNTLENFQLNKRKISPTLDEKTTFEKLSVLKYLF